MLEFDRRGSSISECEAVPNSLEKLKCDKQLVTSRLTLIVGGLETAVGHTYMWVEVLKKSQLA